MDARYCERANHLLRELPAEDNRVIRRWKQLGVVVRNAADSQALLELKTGFCAQGRCLECAIGRAALTRPFQSGQGPVLNLNETAKVYALAGGL